MEVGGGAGEGGGGGGGGREGGAGGGGGGARGGGGGDAAGAGGRGGGREIRGMRTWGRLPLGRGGVGLQPALVEGCRGPGSQQWVHAILHLQQLGFKACLLQPLHQTHPQPSLGCLQYTPTRYVHAANG